MHANYGRRRSARRGTAPRYSVLPLSAYVLFLFPDKCRPPDGTARSRLRSRRTRAVLTHPTNFFHPFIPASLKPSKSARARAHGAEDTARRDDDGRHNDRMKKSSVVLRCSVSRKLSPETHAHVSRIVTRRAVIRGVSPINFLRLIPFSLPSPSRGNQELVIIISVFLFPLQFRVYLVQEYNFCPDTRPASAVSRFQREWYIPVSRQAGSCSLWNDTIGALDPEDACVESINWR